MPKWNLSDQYIYNLLKSTNNVTDFDEDQLLMAYREFVESTITFLDNESDYKTLIRELNLIYIEFEALKNKLEAEQYPCNKIKSITCNKILSFINKELDLLHHQMEFPKFFINIETDWNSILHLNNEVIKLVDIMELVCGIFYIADGIVRVDHKEIFLSDVARIFEKVFNVNLGDIYKKEISVIKRKPTKITEFLDRLKAAIIKKSKDEGYYQP
ncbi:RteC domain-containing protein [uncultured Bacteroides sp.]|uniref:RteC domain-containing protein n=1 Tax=uncultured Bacteroides sp. TaxID=162156 RepID=UPI0025D254F2|nr:RteC domain-containing protein [uncultured Bacteroides sp.]